MAKILWTQKQEVGPSPRFGHALAYDSTRNRTVLFGGSVGSRFSTAVGDTWEWDGENWTQMADVGPSARQEHSMAFDSQRNQTVLFGGSSGRANAFNSDTWAWDGSNWTQLADSGPQGRNSHALAYDSARSVTVLFGGVGSAGLLGDTWEWDGSNWTQREITGPGPRAALVMAYDSNRGRTVLFGGSGNDESGITGTSLGDTWEWDGSTWVQIRDFGASPCMLAALAFKNDSVALFGGVDSINAGTPNTIFPNTWTWDGQHWTLRQHIGPGPRWKHAMAYDTKRGCLVLFGGLSNNTDASALGDTWEHSETS